MILLALFFIFIFHCNDNHKCLNCISVFSNEFMRSSDGRSCRKRNKDILKSFTIPIETSVNLSEVLSKCEKYCALKSNCWGCSKDCTMDCQYNAIPACGGFEEWTDKSSDAIVSIKPGIICHTIKLVVRLHSFYITYKNRRGILSFSRKYLVCFDIATTILGNVHSLDAQRRTTGAKWSLGSCSSTDILGHPNLNTTYTKRCCLEPGEYILSCQSYVPHGWNGGYIELQSKRYCDDFTGYRAMRRVNVKGKYPIEWLLLIQALQSYYASISTPNINV